MVSLEFHDPSGAIEVTQPHASWAIALAMAGGRPEYLPVLVAAVEAFISGRPGSPACWTVPPPSAATRTRTTPASS